MKSHEAAGIHTLVPPNSSDGHASVVVVWGNAVEDTFDAVEDGCPTFPPFTQFPNNRILGGWPTQARFWLERGSSRGVDLANPGGHTRTSARW